MEANQRDRDDAVNEELATHISALAAPIYAALIARSPPAGTVSVEWHKRARAEAIDPARWLGVETLGTT